VFQVLRILGMKCNRREQRGKQKNERRFFHSNSETGLVQKMGLSLDSDFQSGNHAMDLQSIAVD
jgi:hypothetical protein